jgi:putative transposase
MCESHQFEFFDKTQEWRVSHGHLPHWFQAGVTYFITFRTHDSVPQDLVRSWHRQRDHWLRRKGIDPRSTDWRRLVRVTEALDQEYEEEFSQRFLGWLDQGLGDCPLSDPQLARIVADALIHFDGVRYHLGDFVVMPNHVHVLACLIGSAEVEAVCESWKHFSAREINRLRGQKGRFWQEESFDHLVRGADEFAAFQRYIAQNPQKSGLPERMCLLRTLDSAK